jgi:hypothetical protein
MILTDLYTIVLFLYSQGVTNEKFIFGGSSYQEKT